MNPKGAVAIVTVSSSGVGAATAKLLAQKGANVVINYASNHDGAVKAAEAELGSSGRVLLRASGTEPLVRVMVEAQSDAVAQDVATKLAQVVETELK